MASKTGRSSEDFISAGKESACKGRIYSQPAHGPRNQEVVIGNQNTLAEEKPRTKTQGMEMRVQWCPTGRLPRLTTNPLNVEVFAIAK